MKKILTIILAILVVIAFFIPKVLAETSEDQYNKFSDLPQKMSQLQTQIDAKEKEQKDIKSQIDSIDKKLQQIKSEVKEAGAKINKTQLKINDLQKAINDKQKEMDQKKKTLKACIELTYEQDKTSTIEMLVSSDSLSDFMNQEQYISAVEDKTKNIYDQVKKIRDELTDKKQNLDNQKSDLLKLKNKRDIAGKTIEAELATKTIMLGRIQKETETMNQQFLTPQYSVEQSGGKQIFYGIATWYGPGFEGKNTASGIPFDPKRLAAAHQTLPLGSLVKVLNLKTGKSCVVVINDRGPFSYQLIDLTRAAADAIGMESVAPVMLEVL